MRWLPILLVLAACGREIEITDVEVEMVRPGVAAVHFTTSRPAVPRVSWALDGAEGQTPEGPEGTEHTVTVLGLKPERDYAFTATVRDGEREFDAEPITATTPEVGAPPVDLVVPDGGLACDDPYVLVSLSEITGRSWIVVVDRDGDVVWAERGPPQTFVTRAKPSLDGQAILYNHGDALRLDDIGAMVRVPFAGGEPITSRHLSAHHDFVEHADGTVGWLGYVFADMELEGEILPVAADVIYEDAEGVSDTSTAEPVWDVFTGYPPGVWMLDGLEMTLGYFLPGFHEFSHGNSLLYRESDDAYFVMFRWLDALVKIDRATGDFVWQLGGAHSDFTAPADHAFSHAHMSEIWDGGMLMFDNADGTSGVSGVVEYAFDEDAMTYEKVWEYRDPGGGFEFLLGDAHRMKGCDNVLASWTTQRRLTELTRDGEIAWEVMSPTGWLMGRAVPLQDLYTLR